MNRDKLQDAHGMAFGSQTITDEDIAEVLECNVDDVEQILKDEFELVRCVFCGAYEYEYDGDYGSSGFFCEDCIENID